MAPSKTAAGTWSPSALWGRSLLYNRLQSSITTLASTNLWKSSASRHSRRNVPLKLSLLPFCQGLPGSIRHGIISWSFRTAGSLWATSSGPLALRRYRGRRYRAMSCRKTSMTWWWVNERPTAIANQNRVASSLTVRQRKGSPGA